MIPKVDVSDFDIVVHVGAPKTGSSAIQKKFSQNVESFQSQGIYYPVHLTDQNGISGGHWELASCLASNDLDSARKILSKYLDSARQKNCTLLLSAEGFFTLAGKLIAIMPSKKFCVISFLRHPLESFRSSYNQDVKRHFLTQTMREFAESIASMKPAITGGSLIQWREYLPSHQLFVIPYSLDESLDAPLMLAEMLGLQLEKSVFRINRSYTPCSLEFKRMVNTVLDKNNTSMNNHLDLILQRYSDLAKTVSPSLQAVLGNDIYLKLANDYSVITNKISKDINIDLQYEDVPKSGFDFESIDTILDIIKPNKNLLLYISECIKTSFDIKPLSYDLLQLAKMFGIDIRHVIGNKAPVLTQAELEVAVSSNSEMPDVLREFSKVVEKAGDSKSALVIASKALQLRPSGPYLQSLVKRLSNDDATATKGGDR